MYNDVKSCVKHHGSFSDCFSTSVGLMQGDALSPVLFSLFVNDIELDLLNHCNNSYELKYLNLLLLMYADDTVIFSESIEGLQEMLNCLNIYCYKWNLCINTDKTKVIIFCNGGIIRDNEKWYLGDNELEIVNEFNYLGLVLKFNGKFVETQKCIANQGRKALFGLLRKFNDCNLNVETKLYLFDTYVSSILSYSCEIWGYHSAIDIEKVHIDFCKRVLGVSKKCTNMMVFAELGRFPLNTSRKFRIIKYWLKILNTNNCILKSCYELLLDDINLPRFNWANAVKNILLEVGLPHIWDSQQVENKTSFLFTVKQRLEDHFIQDCNRIINSSSKGFLYQHLNPTHSVKNYLKKRLEFVYSKLITKIRLSEHSLFIEVGRRQNIQRENRLCTLCDNKTIEDEFHFILSCPFYHDLRINYIKKYFYVRPSVFKLIKLLNSENIKTLNNFGKYLYKAFLRREMFNKN